MTTRISLLVETDDAALREQIDAIRALPFPDRDQLLAELMAWESRRILVNVGRVRGRRAAFARNGKRNSV